MVEAVGVNPSYTHIVTPALESTNVFEQSKLALKKLVFIFFLQTHR